VLRLSPEQAQLKNRIQARTEQNANKERKRNIQKEEKIRRNGRREEKKSLLVMLYVRKTNTNREVPEAKPTAGVARSKRAFGYPRGKKPSWPLGFLGDCPPPLV
jgi:hypothetical protein